MATLKSIAKICGVSTATVSLVLNNKAEKISPETRALVLKVAAEENYIKNNLAASLTRGKTQTLGLILPNLENEYFASLAGYVNDAVFKNGYVLLLCNSNDDIVQENKQIRTLKGHNIDGLFITKAPGRSTDENSDFEQKIQKLNTPVVFIDRKSEDPNLSYFAANNQKGGYLATKHLLSLGHTRIGHLTGQLTLASAQDRLEGYKRALKESGIRFSKDLVFEGDFQLQSGQSALPYFMRKNCSAVFAANDRMAYGLIMTAIKKNIKIPDEISIIGYDDNIISQACYPTMSTVSQNLALMCLDASSHMMNLLNNEDVGAVTKIYEPTLVIRDSTAPPKKLD